MEYKQNNVVGIEKTQEDYDLRIEVARENNGLYVPTLKKCNERLLEKLNSRKLSS